MDDKYDAPDHGDRGEEQVRPASLLAPVMSGKGRTLGNPTKLGAQPLRAHASVVRSFHERASFMRVGPCDFTRNGDMNGGRPSANKLIRSKSTGDCRASPLTGLITPKNFQRSIKWPPTTSLCRCGSANLVGIGEDAITWQLESARDPPALARLPITRPWIRFDRRRSKISVSVCATDRRFRHDRAFEEPPLLSVADSATSLNVAP